MDEVQVATVIARPDQEGILVKLLQRHGGKPWLEHRVIARAAGSEPRLKNFFYSD